MKYYINFHSKMFETPDPFRTNIILIGYKDNKK